MLCEAGDRFWEFEWIQGRKSVQVVATMMKSFIRGDEEIYLFLAKMYQLIVTMTKVISFDDLKLWQGSDRLRYCGQV